MNTKEDDEHVMVNRRNMLSDSLADVFGVVSERDIAEEQRVAKKFFDAIPPYVDEDRPSKDDIVAAEKVLKYAAQCKCIGFTYDDAILTMRYTTNVLRWYLEIGV